MRTAGGILMVLGLCTWPAGAALGGDVVHVDGASAGCSDATGAPYCGIQAAIDRAAPGATVRIAPGRYELWGESLAIDKSLALQGAGAGRTVIDGEGRHPGPIISIAESAEHVEIRGLTLKNRARIVSLTAGAGGIDHLGPRLLVADAVISDNQGGIGGGLRAGTEFGSVELDNVVVRGNTALVGAGIDFRDAPGASLEVSNSSIRENSAVFTGGGVFIRDVGTVTMINVSISGNESGNQGGGVYLVSQVEAGELDIRDSTISGNWSKGAGGIATSGDDLEVRLGGVVLAGNTSAGDPRRSDCSADSAGVFVSGGGNRVGNGDGCAFRPVEGDAVGTTARPVEATAR